MKDLRGRNALVTGAGGGLGGHIARALAAQGANLAISDLSSVPMQALTEELGGRGTRVEAAPADLSIREEAEGLVARAEDALGPLDVLVNNAGVEFVGAYTVHTVDELEAITWINLLAPMILIRAAVPGMFERGRGHVVNVASVAGKAPLAYFSSYNATKHGLVGLTHALRAEYGDEPVGFSAVCPGIIHGEGMLSGVEDQVGGPAGARNDAAAGGGRSGRAGDHGEQGRGDRQPPPDPAADPAVRAVPARRDPPVRADPRQGHGASLRGGPRPRVADAMP